MGIFSFFSKENKEKLDEGLTKTRESFFTKLSRAVVGKSTIDEDVLDDIEEALITSDVGVETTVKIIDELEKRIAKNKYLNSSEIHTVLEEIITSLFAENKATIEGYDFPQRSEPYVILVVGVNGVGKTTTAINLGAALAVLEYRSLIIDADPQANSTSGVGFDPKNIKTSIYECLMDEVEPLNIILSTSTPNLDLLPAHIDLVGAEIEMINQPNREFMMRKVLHKIKDEYDFMIIDCSPSLGLITVNSLVAADSVIIPVQCEYFALEGLGKLLNTIKIVQQRLNTSLDIEGILLTMYDSRLRLSNQVVDEVKAHFQDMVFETLINRNTKLGEAPSFGETIIMHDINSTGAISYLNLAREILQKNNLTRIKSSEKQIKSENES